jgi:ketosteroid isomerase-like protein
VSVTNLTLVQELYDAFARRDVSAVLARWHPEVELRQTELVPSGGHYRGHAGARESSGGWSRGSTPPLASSASSTPTTTRRQWGGRAAAPGSEIAFDLAVVHIWTVRDGRITRLEVYIDTPAMLKALESR